VFSFPQEGPLEPASIALVPAAHGAYRLWRGARVLFVGVTWGAQTLRSELRRHWRGDYGSLTQSASHFEYLAAPNVAQAHQLYVALQSTSGLREALRPRRR
jgi:hypothetical protein